MQIVLTAYQRALFADTISFLRFVAGTGAVGLYAAAVGARAVMLTDGGPPTVLTLARANAAANRELWSESTCIEAQRLVWGQEGSSSSTDTESPLPPSGVRTGVATPSHATAAKGAGASSDSGLDWIVASDVTYWTGAHAELCWTISALMRAQQVTRAASCETAAAAARAGGCRTLIAHELRPSRPTEPDERLTHFRDEAAAAGLCVDTLQTESLGMRQVCLLEVKLHEDDEKKNYR